MFQITATVEVEQSSSSVAADIDFITVEVSGRNLSEELTVQVAQMAICSDLGWALEDVEGELVVSGASFGSEGSRLRFDPSC